jgi:Glycosyltransferase family 87
MLALRRPSHAILAIGAFALFVGLAIEQGVEERVGHDFHVFWQAGRNFTSGAPLYHDYLPGARLFKYPPFAAMVFQPLGLFPLKVAGVLFSFVNLVLWVLAVWLTREIVVRTSMPRRSTWVPVLLATLLSAQFFLDNFHHVQMNGVILVLILLGIHAHLRERDLATAGYLVAATAIKVSPIFFLAWLFIRGRRRAWLAAAPLAAICVVLPLVLRGPATGVAELREYYDSFLAGHQHGEVREYTRGHNIASWVNRMVLQKQIDRATAAPEREAVERKGHLLYRVMWIAVLVAFLAKLLWLRVRRAPLTAFELSLTFLASLLLSPITFTANLVFLLFVFCSVLWIPVQRIPRWAWLPAGVVFVLMLMTGLSGKDLVGKGVNQFIKLQGIFVLTMLLLYVGTLILAGRSDKAAGLTGSAQRSAG